MEVVAKEIRVFEKFLIMHVDEEGEMGRIPKSLAWLAIGSCQRCQQREGGREGRAGLRDRIPELYYFPPQDRVSTVITLAYVQIVLPTQL